MVVSCIGVVWCCAVVVVFGGNRGNNTVVKRGTTAAAEIAMGGRRRITKRANRGCNASCHVTRVHESLPDPCQTRDDEISRENVKRRIRFMNFNHDTL